MKLRFLALLLLVSIFTTMLCSCEVLKFVNHMLNIFGPDDDNNTNVDIDINLPGNNIGDTGHKHNWVTISGKASTCTEKGYSEKIICSDCDEVYVESQELPLAAHTYDDSADTTCNVCAYTRECSHPVTEVVSGYAATCTAIGLTDGRICSSCGEITVAQEVISATGHTEGEKNTVVEPSTSQDGKWEIRCSACNELLKEGEIPLTGSVGLVYKKNEAGDGYVVSGMGTCEDTEIYITREYEGLPVTEIGNTAFLDCKSLVSIIIPNTVLSIGNGAFRGCTSLANISIPNSVTSMGTMVFYNCDSLEGITIPNGITAIGDNMFGSCSALKNIEIPDSVISIGVGSFASCTSLESIKLPQDYSLTSIGANAFRGCVSLVYINLPISVRTIGDGAFYNCSLLPDIQIPIALKSIGDSTFYGCDMLTAIRIPESVTSIGDKAFLGCESLHTVDIPASVKSIGTQAFYNCGALDTIKFFGTYEQWENIEKGEDWDNNTAEYILWCDNKVVNKDGTEFEY